MFKITEGPPNWPTHATTFDRSRLNGEIQLAMHSTQQSQLSSLMQHNC